MKTITLTTEETQITLDCVRESHKYLLKLLNASPPPDQKQKETIEKLITPLKGVIDKLIS